MTATHYPIIANCNFESRDDTTIHEIRKAIERQLIENDELVEAMDELESTLAEYAEDNSADAIERCRKAEESVSNAWTAEVKAEVKANREARYSS